MKPINFKESNITLSKPGNMTDEDCGPLSIFRNTDRHPPQLISCFKGNWKEGLTFLFTGKMWLGVISYDTQPPVWLTTYKSFKSVEKEPSWYFLL